MKPLEDMSDDELSRRAGRATGWRIWLDKYEGGLPVAAGVAVFAGLILAGKIAALFLDPVFLPLAAVVGATAGIVTICKCCATPPDRTFRQKIARELASIEQERKMRALERSPGFQEKLARGTQRLREAFGTKAAIEFHEGTEEAITVPPPLTLRKPASRFRA
jgi:hypothetical protein